MSSIAELAARRPVISDEPAPAESGAIADDALVWRDVSGKPYAICRHVENCAEVSFPGLGRFRCDEDGNISARLRPGAGRDQLLEAFFRFGLPLLLHARGAEFLHASAVLGPSGVVGFCAPSGTGKSTTAYGLAARGYQAWADDALVLERRGDGFTALGLPFAFRAWPDVIEHFADRSSHPSVRAPEAGVDVAPLAALCILRPGDGDPKAPVPLPASRAFKQVLSHSFSFEIGQPDRNAAMVDAYMTMASSVPVFEAVVGNSLESLPSHLDGIESAIFGG